MEYKLHKPVDRADPGFELPGKKLRWISPDVAESRGDRPFMVLSKDLLDPKLVDHIKKTNPSAFSEGNTIRRGKLVLAYTTESAFKDYKEEIREAARSQEQSVKQIHGVKSAGRDHAKVTDNETTDDTQRMIELFKNKKNKEE